MLVNCKQCSAQISDDREKCPHCDTPVLTTSESFLFMMSQLAQLEFRLGVAQGRPMPDPKELRAELVDLEARVIEAEKEKALKDAEETRKKQEEAAKVVQMPPPAAAQPDPAVTQLRQDFDELRGLMTKFLEAAAAKPAAGGAQS